MKDNEFNCGDRVKFTEDGCKIYHATHINEIYKVGEVLNPQVHPSDDIKCILFTLDNKFVGNIPIKWIYKIDYLDYL